MKVLMTGLKGTLAPKVASEFTRRGATCVGWDRETVPPERQDAAAKFLEAIKPDAICHFALGSESWAALMADFSFHKNIPFLFTSTAMVFHDEPDGPHYPDDARTARDDYGKYKIRCEDAVRSQNPNTIITRIGWQIDAAATGNNMLAHLDQWQERDGKIEASRQWKPACSFMTDTAMALWNRLKDGTPGIYHLDSNARSGYTFDQIVTALKEKFARQHWRIEVTESYCHDQRLAGHENLIADPSDRLNV